MLARPDMWKSLISKTLYISKQLIVKETLWLYPPGPLIPCSANTDCTLSIGYHVAVGTHVMLNVWKIQHDERVWPNPDEFQPERFLIDNKDTEVRGLNFKLVPFGCGRKACAGISLALQVVHLTLASLLQSFEMMKPSNVAMDMTESPGLTYIKATPLEVVIIPRLDPKLYMQ